MSVSFTILHSKSFLFKSNSLSYIIVFSELYLLGYCRSMGIKRAHRGSTRLIRPYRAQKIDVQAKNRVTHALDGF